MTPASLLTKVLVAILAMRECMAATFDLKNASSTPLQHTLRQATPCFYMGREIVSSEYLVGSLGMPGSIYGECHDGHLTCYHEPVAGSLNRSVVEVACPSHASERRRLGFGSPEKVCLVNKERVKGFQYLHGARPRMHGSYMAFCDERTINGMQVAVLTCFKDDGVSVNSKRGAKRVKPMPIVDCKNVPAAAPKSVRRRLAVWDSEVAGWPKGVVCYVLATRSADPTYKPRMDKFFEERVKPHFVEFKAKAGIHFVHLDMCGTETPGACLDCKHALVIDAPPDEDDCRSDVGFKGETQRDMEDEVDTDYEFDSVTKPTSTQEVVYGSLTDEEDEGPPRCHVPRAIAHELGHVLGLDHDHQHQDRKEADVILQLDSNGIDDYHAKLSKLWAEREFAREQEATEELNLLIFEWERKIESVVAKMARKIADFAILASSKEPAGSRYRIGGSYDIDSVMHYTERQGLCIRKEKYKSTNFCDYGEDQLDNNCEPGNSAVHCDEGKTQAQWPPSDLDKGATDRDYALIEEMYVLKDAERAEAQAALKAALAAEAQANPNKRQKVEDS